MVLSRLRFAQSRKDCENLETMLLHQMVDKVLDFSIKSFQEKDLVTLGLMTLLTLLQLATYTQATLQCQLNSTIVLVGRMKLEQSVRNSVQLNGITLKYQIIWMQAWNGHLQTIKSWPRISCLSMVASSFENQIILKAFLTTQMCDESLDLVGISSLLKLLSSSNWTLELLQQLEIVLTVSIQTQQTQVLELISFQDSFFIQLSQRGLDINFHLEESFQI